MSDTGSSGDNKPQQQDEVNLVPLETVPEIENKPVTPVKRTPSKRVSAVERAQRESEELVKTLGGSLDIEGGRKTRSSTRGTPSRSVVDTPPPKKARASSGTPRRGRGRKLDTSTEDEAKKTPEKISPESNSAKEESLTAVDAAATEENKEDSESKPKEDPTTDAEEKLSPAKQEDKPEPMEVDGGGNEDTETPAEPEEMAEPESAPQSATEILDNEHEENLKELESPDESEKVVEQESSSAVEEITPVTPPPAPVVAAPEATPVEDEINSAVDNQIVENSVENNIDVNNSKEKTNSIQVAAESLPTPPSAPAQPVSPAGNDHKAESNDFCEPKIASPPITANNDSATPQYCN